jgi:DNA-directed RNA polymerase specialized sigma24 family protein
MIVTDFDERNIKYFAGNYCCNAAPFEDLVQEGWLAALGSKHETHKYNNIRQAIRVYKKQSVFLPNSSSDKERPSEDRGLEMIDNLDHLKHLLEITPLSPSEVEVINETYFGEELTQKELAARTQTKWATIRKRHSSAMQKLRQTVIEEEEAKNED